MVFICIFCGVEYFTKKHSCNTKCQIKDGKLIHFSICKPCGDHLLVGFEDQIKQSAPFNPPRRK